MKHNFLLFITLAVAIVFGVASCASMGSAGAFLAGHRRRGARMNINFLENAGWNRQGNLR